jgi:tetraacyldisaccharide 4'-kinase
MMRAPDFWYPEKATLGGVLAPLLLSPAAIVYDQVGRWRQRSTIPTEVGAATICVGNLVSGGSGKTPVALAVANRLAVMGHKVAFLTRGYGGTEEGPLVVDKEKHTSIDVGDEPLLLAERHMTLVAHDRVAGAEFAVAQGADVIVMDDGFQNPYLKKDLSFVVIDGEVGFGNRMVIPSGPLRETISYGLKRANAVILMGETIESTCMARVQQSGLPIVRAKLSPLRDNAFVSDEKVVAFAGIGRPSKFFMALRELGADLAATKSFSDHHQYSEHELRSLEAMAAQHHARLVTTEKDWVRLSPENRQRVQVFRVRAKFDDEDQIKALLTDLSPN